jgi:hypothetical protein
LLFWSFLYHITNGEGTDWIVCAMLSHLDLLYKREGEKVSRKGFHTLTHSHTMTPFDAPGNKLFENTVGKGEIARNEQFLLFPQWFLPV